MKILEHIFASFFFSFGDWGVYAQEQDKSLPKANAEYGDSKFSEAEAIIEFRIQISQQNDCFL
jgi:hypothetical protein